MNVVVLVRLLLFIKNVFIDLMVIDEIVVQFVDQGTCKM